MKENRKAECRAEERKRPEKGEKERAAQHLRVLDLAVQHDVHAAIQEN